MGEFSKILKNSSQILAQPSDILNMNCVFKPIKQVERICIRILIINDAGRSAEQFTMDSNITREKCQKWYREHQLLMKRMSFAKWNSDVITEWRNHEMTQWKDDKDEVQKPMTTIMNFRIPKWDSKILYFKNLIDLQRCILTNRTAVSIASKDSLLIPDEKYVRRSFAHSDRPIPVSDGRPFTDSETRSEMNDLCH